MDTDGPKSLYYKSGVLKATFFVINKKIEGKCVLYYPNGKKFVKGFFFNGRIYYKFDVWYDTGKKNSRATTNDAKEILRVFNDENEIFIGIARYNETKPILPFEIHNLMKAPVIAGYISLRLADYMNYLNTLDTSGGEAEGRAEGKDEVTNILSTEDSSKDKKDLDEPPGEIEATKEEF